MIAVLLGPPGAGKGTQAKHVADQWRLTHVSTGEVLRQAIAAGTDLGREVKALVEAGRLVPDETVSRVVVERMLAGGDEGGFLLDGFPRNVEQARLLEQFVNEQGLPTPVVLELVVPEDEVVRRLGARRSCPKHGDPGPGAGGTCPRCGGELAGRADDAPDVVRARLVVYRNQTAPVAEYYRERGALLTIDGAGEPAEVAGRVDDALSRWCGT